MRIHFRYWPVTAAALFLTQCGWLVAGPTASRAEAVSGSIAVEGKPLRSGVVTFLPDSHEIPTQGGGMVVEGKYSIPRTQGLVPGKYRIVITSPDDTPEVIPGWRFQQQRCPGKPPIPAKQVIPPPSTID